MTAGISSATDLRIGRDHRWTIRRSVCFTHVPHPHPAIEAHGNGVILRVLAVGRAVSLGVLFGYYSAGKRRAAAVGDTQWASLALG